ncbi:thioredoxin family protein [Patescibacteria group bacterium]|nr:thioredoxin family protein [Patescibacteria group bacterium]
MKIQVLGSGCPTCQKLYELVDKTVKEMGLDTKVEYLTGNEGTTRIVELGIMSSPVLVINDKPVMVGFTPDILKLKDIFSKNLE